MPPPPPGLPPPGRSRCWHQADPALPPRLQQAAKLAEAALKKYKGDQLVRALKGYALHRSGKPEDALQVGSPLTLTVLPCHAGSMPPGRAKRSECACCAAGQGLPCHALSARSAALGARAHPASKAATQAPRCAADARHCGGGPGGGASCHDHGVHIQGGWAARGHHAGGRSSGICTCSAACAVDERGWHVQGSCVLCGVAQEDLVDTGSSLQQAGAAR